MNKNIDSKSHQRDERRGINKKHQKHSIYFLRKPGVVKQLPILHLDRTRLTTSRNVRAIANAIAAQM